MTTINELCVYVCMFKKKKLFKFVLDDNTHDVEESTQNLNSKVEDAPVFVIIHPVCLLYTTV